MKVKELIQEFKQGQAEGYSFDVYFGRFRGRDYIAEVSGMKLVGGLPRGYSYMAAELGQRQMRQVLKALELSSVNYRAHAAAWE